MTDKNRVKSYEKLITKALNGKIAMSLSVNTSLENLEPPVAKKKRLKKGSCLTNIDDELTNLELAIGIYHFLMLDARKYANKWNFSSLISLLETEPANNKDAELESHLVKWFVVKICSLILSLTPVQESRLFQVYFKSDSILEQCSLR